MLLVLLVWWIVRREFDGVTDGMVYAGICAAGFAFTENIQYLAQAYSRGRRRGAHRHLRRAVPAVALRAPDVHRALRHRRRRRRDEPHHGCRASSRRVLGFLLAVLSHALWNLAAVVGRPRAWSSSTCSSRCRSSWRSSGSSCGPGAARAASSGSSCAPYADAGWLSPAEVTMLSSMPQRREARAWARANTGRQGLAAMRAFQDTASELALLRRRMYHSAADEHAIAQERELLEALRARRAEFIGMPGA